MNYVVDKLHVEKFRKNLSKDGKYFTTLNGIKVRSKSEQYIADWLYRHNLQFEYEPLVNIKDFDFNPDFHIPAANVYLEHVSNNSYSMRDKEEQFEKGGLLLVKTYEHMTKDSALFNHTLDMIIKSRVSKDAYLDRSITYREEFKHAKDKLFLITEKGNESSFLKEIPDSFTVKTTMLFAPVVEKYCHVGIASAVG